MFSAKGQLAAAAESRRRARTPRDPALDGIYDGLFVPVEDPAIGVVCDVRDYRQVCLARDQAVQVFGSIDVMCNFAGGTAVRMQKVDVQQYPEFPDVPMDVYDWGIDVNLKGPFYFAEGEGYVGERTAITASFSFAIAERNQVCSRKS